MGSEKNNIMNKTFFLYPRRSGKTTLAFHEYIKDIDHTILIVPTEDTLDKFLLEFKNDSNVSDRNIIISKHFLKEIKKYNLNKLKNIIIDDYLSIVNKIIIYDYITKYLNPEKIFIFSTPQYFYDKQIIDLVKKIKTRSIEGIDNFTLNSNDFLNLYYNYITDNDINIITKQQHISFKEKNEIIKIQGKNNFELETLYNYLK